MTTLLKEYIRPLSAIVVLSTAAIGFLLWLIYFREASAVQAGFVSYLPAVNALFNFASAVCLVCGFMAIRKQQITTHIRFMVSAFIFSSLFLVTYIIYHSIHGDSHFMGEGLIRIVYFIILISHIILSIVILPFILLTLFMAVTKKFRLHKAIAKFTLPFWLYVSVTGVIIFLMLKFFP